ncbi:MAG: MBL fold metallo-hydrolase [Bacteroidales bacterium]|nr:MBL fold metallo-hydrolase [Bacteroidales bacterium]
MKISFLGTGTSQGIPVIGCECHVCNSSDEHDKRLRTSLLVTIKGNNFVVDTGPDFRQQMLRHKVKKLSAVLFTHEHKDHVAGLDDVRSFNFIMKSSVKVFAERRVQEALKREFLYAFSDLPYPGLPQIEMHEVLNRDFTVNGVKITPVRLMHYKLPIFGYKFGKVAYLTDVKTIPVEELDKLQNLDCLIITALRKTEHISHMSLSEALQTIRLLKPKKAYLTHLSHLMGKHKDVQAELPENVFLAYDGLTVDFED